MRSRNLSLHCAFTFFSLVLGLGSTFVLPAQTGTSEQLPAPAGSSSAANSICPSCIRATVEFLASDALRGRGSRTRDELLAATYLASLLRAYQVDPAGDAGGFIQQVRIPSAKLTRKTWNVVGVLRGTD